MAHALSLGAAVGRYLTGRRHELRPSSFSSIRGNLRNFASETGPDRLLARLRQAHVEQWLRAHWGAPAGNRHRLSIVRTFFAWHVAAGDLRHDPTTGIRAIAVPRRLPRGVAPIVVAALLQVADPRGQAIILLEAQEGLRRCEVVQLEIGDIDPDDRALLVRGKGGHERVLPISDETWAALGSYLAEYPASAGPLIRSYLNPHDPISAAYISGLFRKWRAEAAVFVTPHRLRHTAATDMLRNGAHVRDVQTALGHASLATTQLYMPWVVNDLRSAMGGRSYTHPADGHSVRRPNLDGTDGDDRPTPEPGR